MSHPKNSRKSTILLALMAVVFTLALVMFPKQGFEAGMSGLKVFWDIVFPSLLPFFILAEILLGLGVVRGFGVLLEPLMRPLFSVPGVGAFALSMGLAAGYPMDAVITARFRETNQCTQIEGERLLAFTNTADPLFMFGAVAVGMFKSPELGVLLAIAHYVSAFLVGIVFKFWGRKVPGSVTPRTVETGPRMNIFVRAYREMLQSRDEDGRPFGKLLGTSVTDSIQTLLMICGFIVFFAVLIEMLHLSGIMAVLGLPVVLLYHTLGIHTSLVNPTLAGLLELDIGSAQASSAIAAPLLQKVALVSGIIAWSGLAVHAQVASVLTQTDIRMKPYFIARFLHALLATVLTVVFYQWGIGVPLAHAFANGMPVFAAIQSATNGAGFWNVAWTGVSTWFSIIGGLVIISLVTGYIRRVRVVAWHTGKDKAA